MNTKIICLKRKQNSLRNYNISYKLDEPQQKQYFSEELYAKQNGK